MSRRGFLALSGLIALGATGCGAPSGPPPLAAAPLSLATPLRIPAVLEPTIGADGQKRFALTLQAGRREFLPGLSTATWGINGDYLGPTVRAARGDRVAMEVSNQLGEVSTLHWHGMRLPAVMDGGPHQMVEPDVTWSPSWTIDQPANTGWYHPHAHGTTAQHVYRGLAGLFLVDDDEPSGRQLPHQYGVDDIPLILQDKSFDAAGALVEDARTTDASLGPLFGILGNHILVNGTYDPFVEITTTAVRFRILNASNARMYHIGFADNRGFDVIGTDAGLLAAPVATERVALTPGERVEIVAEFTAGERVVLRSFAGDVGIASDEFDLLQIVAASQLTEAPTLPSTLSAVAPVSAPPAGARVRRFTLSGDKKINSREFDMTRIDEVVPAGAREIWELDNIVFEHNFHIHEVAFTILDIGGAPPPPWLAGPKDTVYVPPRTIVRIAVEFGRDINPQAPYMYHCHILQHEDRGMMGQFVIVEPGTENQPLPPIDAAGAELMHGH